MRREIINSLLDLFGEGRLEIKWSYFQPLEGFLKAHSLSYATEKRHKGGRKETILAQDDTRRTSLLMIYAKSDSCLILSSYLIANS